MKKKGKKRRRGLLAAGAAVLLVLAAAGWWLASRPEPDAGNRTATARAVRRDFSAAVLATGAVKPQIGAKVKVGARISGKVTHLYANIGDEVKKGQVIAELEKEDLEAAAARARAGVEEAKAKLAAARARLALAEKEHRRQKRLNAKEFASRQALDRAESELGQARAGLALAQSELTAARAALRQAEVKLSYATITAPISGVIGAVATQEGETVSAGLNAPTFVTIIDLARLQVDAFVDEVDIGKVRPGQAAVFTVDAFPGREFHGRVSAIYPDAVIQDNVVDYDVVVSITDPYQGLLRPEMTANVTIFLKQRKGVLAVPGRAVKRERGKNVVYVPTARGPEPRPVGVGWKDGRWIEITRGLREGDTVLLERKRAGKQETGDGKQDFR